MSGDGTSATPPNSAAAERQNRTLEFSSRLHRDQSVLICYDLRQLLPGRVGTECDGGGPARKNKTPHRSEAFWDSEWQSTCPELLPQRGRGRNLHSQTQSQRGQAFLDFGEGRFAEVADLQQVIFGAADRSRTEVIPSDSRQLVARTERFSSARDWLRRSSSSRSIGAYPVASSIPLSPASGGSSGPGSR